MSDKSRVTTGNHLLDTLSQQDFDYIVPYLKSVSLPTHSCVYTAGQPIDDIFFLTEGMASIIAEMNDGSAVEVGIVGREGLVGALSLLGDDRAAHEVCMQIAGSGLRMPVTAMHDMIARSDALKNCMSRYALYLFAQIAQTAACNARHPVEHRLARCLLMAHDRVVPGELQLTQEVLSVALGVQRPGVSIAAGALKKAGLIDYSHGHITVVNRQALETASCGCYRVVKDEFDRLFP